MSGRDDARRDQVLALMAAEGAQEFPELSPASAARAALEHVSRLDDEALGSTWAGYALRYPSLGGL